MSSRRIQGITIEIGGDTTGLNKSLSSVDKAIRNTQNSLRDVNKLLKMDPKNTELLKQKQELLATAIDKTKDRLEQLKQASEQASKSASNYDEWKAKFDPIQQEITETNTKLKELQATAKEAKTALGEGRISKEQYDQIQNEVKETKTKLDELKTSAKAVSDEFGHPISPEQYNALQREIVETTQNLKELESQAKQSASALGTQMQVAGEKLTEVGGKISELGSNISRIGEGLTAKLSLPIIAGFTASAKAAIDWESAMTGVQKTVNEEYEGMYEDLGNGIKEMSTKMASSKEDIAGVMEVAGQLGVSGKENLLRFTETMVQLGDTTNLSSDEVATALARFLNITEGSYENVDRIGSAIVDLGNNFATSESEIVEMSTRLASAGTIAGLSSTEILALSAAMSSVGIQAEAGGTAMTQTLTAIEEAVSKAGDAVADKSGEMGEKLEKIAEIAGMTSEEFSTAWKEKPAEALTAFISGLGNLEEKGESATLVLDDLEMSGIRQSNMLKSLSLASDQLSGAMETSNKAYQNNNALAEEAAKRYSTMASKLKQTGERIKNVGIDIGDRLLPYIEKILDKVEEWIKAWDNLDDAHKDQIIQIGAVVAAIGPALLIIGKVTSAVGGLVTGIGSASKAIGSAMTAVTAANPVLLAVVATIGAIVAGIAICTTRMKEAHEAAAALTEEEQALANGAKEANAAFDAQAESYRNVVAQTELEMSAQQRLIDELNGIVDANGRVKAGYEERAQVITGELANAFGIEIQYQDGVIQKYGEVMAKIDEVIAKKKAEALLDAGQQAYIDALNGQAQAWDNVKDSKESLNNATKELDAAEEELDATYHQLMSSGDLTSLSSAMLSQKLREQAETVQGAKEKVDTLTQAVADNEEAYYRGQATITNYENLMHSLDGTYEEVSAAADNFSNGLMRAGETSTEVLAKQATDAQIHYQSMVDAVRNGEAQISEEKLSEARQFAEEAKAEFDKATQMAEDEGKNFTDGYYKGMDFNADSSGQHAEQLAQRQIDSLRTTQDSHSPSGVAEEEGKNFVDGYLLGIDEKIPEAEAKSQELFQAITSAFSAGGDAAATGMEGATDASGAEGSTLQPLMSQLDAFLEFVNTKIEMLQERLDLFKEEFNESEALWYEEFMEIIEEQITAFEERITMFTDGLKEKQTLLWDDLDLVHDERMQKLQDKTVKKLDEIKKKFDEWAKKLKEDAKKWGADIIQNLIDGMESKIPDLIAECQKIASIIAQYIHFSVPDKGPLSDFDESMPDMIDLMVKGIDDNIWRLQAANERMAAALIPEVAQDTSMQTMSADMESTSGNMAVIAAALMEYLPVMAEDRQVILYPDRVVGELAQPMNRALGEMM